MKFKVPLILGAVALCGAISASSRDAEAVPPGAAVNHRIRNAFVDRCQTAVPGEVFVQNTGCVTTSSFQRWRTVSAGGIVYAIQNVGLSNDLGFPMCEEAATPQAGVELTLNPCVPGQPSQQWTVIPAGPDRYRICQSDGLNYYCKTAGAAGTNIRLEQYGNNPLQIWRFLP